ncbi:putative PAN domain protein [Trichinella spiralis]|uniref:putative PAN domain protein n=1 Tax=Trichinella spiralis TaxID=6334 RepID=UPI0001EFEEFA|nr:putative PAN domain protein [Trichinella spiralis]
MHSTQLYYCIIIAVNMMVGTADVFTVYLFELNTSCLLKHVYSDGSSRQGFLENVYNTTIDDCIYQCFCKSSGTQCNLVQFIKDTKKCTLYNSTGRKLLKNSDNEQSNVSMFFVFKCEPGYQSSLTDTFSRNHFTLHTLYSAKSEIWGQTCLLEQRDLEHWHRVHFLGISYGSLESCIFTCSAYASVTSCNAVTEYNNSCSYYNFKVREPPLQNSTAYTSGITIIHLCFTSINRNIKEASVHLFRYFELCTVRSFPIRSLDNLFILKKFYDIRSFHMCLNLCREMITSWPYRAVVYSKKSKKCAVLSSGIGYGTGKLCENMILTEVRDFTFRTKAVLFESENASSTSLLVHYHCCKYDACAFYDGSKMELFTEPNINTLPVFRILDCDEEFGVMCLLEMRYVESNFDSTFLGNSIGSLEACVFTCYEFAISSSCNAIIHVNELCSHYYFEVNKPPPRSPPVKSLSLIILHLCFEHDLHVSSYDVKYGDDLHYLLTPFPFPIKRNDSMNGTQLFVKAIESAIRLFKYYELCILRTFPVNNLESIFPLKRFYGVLSFSSCLHLCRQTISTWPYRAVAYIKSEKKCTIFGSGVGQKVKALEKNLQITELRQCMSVIDEFNLDRAEERLNNPPPLKYFFEETSDICFVELNTLNYSNYFNVIQQTQNVESFMQCLRNCRKALLQCTAIDYTTKKQCSFLKRVPYNGTFRKHENSVFAELLYCESASMTDLINDF